MSPPPDPAAPPSPLPLLVVEDDPDLLEMARHVLEGAGHRVLTAPSAEAALETVEAVEVAALVCDIVLPGASGLELSRRLLAERPHLRIVLTSGQRTPDVADAVAASGLPFLPKPYTATALRDAVASVLAAGADR